MQTPCAVTEVKYASAVREGAGRGLLAHICHTPRTAATAKAAKATQRWARVRDLACVTGRSPIGARLELTLRDDPHRGPHLAVSEATELMTGHQQIARLGEHRMDLADIARDDHRVDVGPRDQDAVDHIRSRKPQGNGAVCGHDQALRLKGELRCDDASCDLIARLDARAEISFREFATQV